jgi:hypothetical protein
MLKELNKIAGDLLSLQGYPTQPAGWSALFGSRPGDGDGKRNVRPHARPARKPAAKPSATVHFDPTVSARGHVYW